METENYKMYMQIYWALIEYFTNNGMAAFAAYIAGMIDTTRKDAEKARKRRKYEKALDLMYCLALYRSVQDFIDGTTCNSVFGCINDTGKAPDDEMIARYLYDEYEYSYGICMFSGIEC